VAALCPKHLSQHCEQNAVTHVQPLGALVALRLRADTERCSVTDKNDSVVSIVHLEAVGLDSSQEGGQANLTLQV